MVCPNELGRQVFSENTSLLSVHFRAQWPSGENLFVESRAHVFPAHRSPRLERTGRELCRLAQKHFPGVRLHLLIQTTSYRTYWRMQKIFTQWLLDFSDVMIAEGRSFTQQGEYDPRVVRAVNYLNSAPLNEPFPGDQLQQETGLGRARLERLFHDQVGVHMKMYWDRLRLQAATHDIGLDGLSVKAVCYRVGFKQQSHFSKWFARHTGMSPLAYRQQIESRRRTASF